MLTGYQEVITDPSYAGQIITFTYPHIGNYGANATDDEAARPHCSGRDRPRSGPASQQLAKRGGPRRLPRTQRRAGHRGCRHPTTHPSHPRSRRDAGRVRHGGRDHPQASSAGRARHRRHRPRSRRDHADRRTRSVADRVGWSPTTSGSRPRSSSYLGEIATVEVVPASTPAADVLARNPDGVFLSNGPGDPAAVGYATDAIRDLLGQVPVFGICLGHQLLGTALGGGTFKLPFGHHGGNHPVRNLATEPSRSRVRTTTTRSPTTRSRVSPRSRIATSTTAWSKVCASSMRRRSACSTTPKRDPGPHDARYLFARVRRPHARDGVPSVMPRRDDITSVMVIGSGPIVIGQACEFDYSGTQACRVLREEGYRVILANSNPATIMTDPDFADATYVEPLDASILEKIIERERPDALLPTLGGQTALNLAMELIEPACSTSGMSS